MNYEELVELLKKERANSSLSKVNETIYEEMEELLKEKEALSKTGNILFVKEYENSKKLVERIKEERMKKLFFFAIHSIFPNNATKKEISLYEKFKFVIKEFFEEKEKYADYDIIENTSKDNKKEQKSVEEMGEYNDIKKEEQTSDKINNIQESHVKKNDEKAMENENNDNEGEKEGKEVEIKVIHFVDAYRGLDGVVYGPFSPGEIVRINKEEAEWLVDSGYAEYNN